MEQFRLEVQANFENGFAALRDNVAGVLHELEVHKPKFSESYARLVSLQAWRSELLCNILDEESEAFFKEAHNDALMSHALARQGAWRVALMSMRSLIENTFFGLYYCEHPVELQQWLNGNHKLGFTELTAYLSRHPRLSHLEVALTGIEALKKEYSTLSKAVHGSSKTFRMTRTGVVTGLNINSAHDLGAWCTRETMTISSVNMLMMCFFAPHISGAALPNLRKSISLAVPVKNHTLLKEKLQIMLRQ